MEAYDITAPATFTAGNSSDIFTLLFAAASFKGCYLASLRNYGDLKNVMEIHVGDASNA
jgi:hypothetical protein